MLFGTAKRSSNLRDLMKEHLVNFVSRYKYLGVTLGPALNINDHLQKTLKIEAVCIRFLKRMRHSLSSFASESAYVYCSV